MHSSSDKLPCYDIALFPKWHNIKFNKSNGINNLTFLKHHKIKTDQRSLSSVYCSECGHCKTIWKWKRQERYCYLVFLWIQNLVSEF